MVVVLIIAIISAFLGLLYLINPQALHKIEDVLNKVVIPDMKMTDKKIRS